MSPTLQRLKSAIEELSISERAELAHDLLRSLDDSFDGDAKSEWLNVAEERMADVRSGKVTGIPAEEVLRNLLGPRS